MQAWGLKGLCRDLVAAVGYKCMEYFPSMSASGKGVRYRRAPMLLLRLSVPPGASGGLRPLFTHLPIASFLSLSLTALLSGLTKNLEGKYRNWISAASSFVGKV